MQILILLVSALNNHDEFNMQKISDQFKSKHCLKVGTHSDLEFDADIDVDCRVDSYQVTEFYDLREPYFLKNPRICFGYVDIAKLKDSMSLFVGLSRHLNNAAQLLDEFGPVVAAEEPTFAMEKIAQLQKS